MAVVALAAQATDLTVYDGTATSSEIPISARFIDWGPYTHQVIYPEAQLTAMVGQDITSVKYYVQNEGGCALSGGKVSLSIGKTENAAFTDYSPSFITEGLTKVAEMAMTVGVQEVVFTFDEPWKYEGGNIVIQTVIEEDGSNYGSTATYFFGQNTGIDCTLIGKMTLTKSDFAPKTTFTYAGEEPQTNVVTSLAQANALEATTGFTFNGDAVVTVQSGDYLFLRDNSGYCLIYGAVDGTFENGQVLNQNWNATKADDTWTRYIDATGLSASGETNADLAAPIEATSIDESMLNAYVVYKNVSFSMFQRKITLEDGTTIPTYNLFGGNMPAGMGEPTRYNFYGVIGMQGSTLKLIPVKIEDYVEPQPEWELGDVNHSGGVDIDDVTILINKVLGNTPETYFAEQANCNGDAEGMVDIDDVTALITRVLTGSW